MKTLLIAALALTGITLISPDAQARDRHDHRDSYRSSRSSYSYARRDCAPRYYRSYSYHRSEPRYYYRPSRSYSYSERCEPDRRRSFRPPLISFLFGF